MVIQRVKDERESDGGWSLALSRIRPSLEDLHQAIRMRDLRKVSFHIFHHTQKQKLVYDQKACSAEEVLSSQNCAILFQVHLLCSYSLINTDSSLRSVTALSLAVQQGGQAIVAILLEHGANANKLSYDWNGRLETPLFTSCRQANYETARMLLEYGADVNAADFNMHTPLWIATRERALALVNLLVDSGANLNAGHKRSPCPLYLATKYLGRSEIAKSLIRHGCKLDPTDVEGRGALYWTLANNLADVFKMLICAGAHVNRRDRDNMTNNRSMPAALRQNEELIEWIQHELRNPPPLLRLSGNAIRRRLSECSAGRSIWNRVEKLPIPNNLKNNLKMTDLSQ